MTRPNYRDYELSVFADGGAITVTPPFQIAFKCLKSIAGGLNRLDVDIKGLSESSRLAIVKDAEERKRIPVIFRVGYEDRKETIFQGTLWKGSNDRQGPEFISSLQCLDGGEDYFNGFTSKTVTDKNLAVDQVLADLPNTRRGKITEQATLTRPKVLVGNPIQLLKRYLQPGETLYIDNEQLFIIKDDEVVESFAPLVAPRTGLLSTPEKENQKITFETLINSSLKLGSLCNLESTGATYLNGTYRIESMTYTGDYEGQDWKQSVTALIGAGFKVL